MAISLFGFKASGLNRRQFFWATIVPILKSAILSGRRFILLMILIGISIFLSLHKGDQIFYDGLRIKIIEIVIPIIDVMNKPIKHIQQRIERFQAFTDLQAVGASLEAAQHEIEEWKAVAFSLKRENAQLRDLLKTIKPLPMNFVTAKVLGTAAGTEYKSVMLATRSVNALSKNAAVVTPLGVIGRIVAIGHHTTQVALITDINARTPVRFMTTGEHAILAGTGTRMLEITHRHQDFSNNHDTHDIYQKPTIQVGETLITSGYGGVYPADLPVARVIRVEKINGTEKITAVPFANPQTIDFAQILVNWDSDDVSPKP